MINTSGNNKSNAIIKHILSILPSFEYSNLRAKVGIIHKQVIKIKAAGIAKSETIEPITLPK